MSNWNGMKKITKTQYREMKLLAVWILSSTLSQARQVGVTCLCCGNRSKAVHLVSVVRAARQSCPRWNQCYQQDHQVSSRWHLFPEMDRTTYPNYCTRAPQAPNISLANQMYTPRSHNSCLLASAHNADGRALIIPWGSIFFWLIPCMSLN